MTGLRASCLSAICSGYSTIAQIAAHLHEPEDRVRNSVCKLTGLGLARRCAPQPGRVRYEPVPAEFPETVGGQRAAAAMLAKCWVERV